jgi:hypothetical protein
VIGRCCGAVPGSRSITRGSSAPPSISHRSRRAPEELPDGDVATLETVADLRALSERITALDFAEDAAEARAALDQALGQALGR